MLRDRCIERIKRIDNEEQDLYINTLLNMNVSIPLDFDNLSDEMIYKIDRELDMRIALRDSDIDHKKLADAIQGSRSGIGGSAMTNFTCQFCGKVEIWSNTNVPEMCNDCSTDMAKKIIKHYNIMK